LSLRRSNHANTVNRARLRAYCFDSLVLENGSAGLRYPAVGEEGVILRDIAAVIGAGLNVPVESISRDEAPAYFGWLANFAMLDLAASGAATRQLLGWRPAGPDLLTDLRNRDLSAA